MTNFLPRVAVAALLLAVAAAPARADSVYMCSVTSTGSSVNSSTYDGLDGGTACTFGAGQSYEVICDAKAYVQAVKAATNTATTNDKLVPATFRVPLKVEGSQTYVAVLSQTGTATCRFFKAWSLPQPATAGTSAPDRAPGAWDCAATPAGTLTSTGTTNHGNLTVTAGAYVKGYCTGFAYVGGATTLLSDGGNLATCASQDGGTIPNADCKPVATYEPFYIDLRNTTRNSVGATSGAAATVNCPVSVCAN